MEEGGGIAEKLEWSHSWKKCEWPLELKRQGIDSPHKVSRIETQPLCDLTPWFWRHEAYFPILIYRTVRWCICVVWATKLVTIYYSNNKKWTEPVLMKNLELECGELKAVWTGQLVWKWKITMHVPAVSRNRLHLPRLLHPFESAVLKEWQTRLYLAQNSKLCELPVRPSVWASLLKRPPLTVRTCILYFFPGVRSSNLCCFVVAASDVLLRRIPFSLRSRISYLSAMPTAFCQLTIKEWLLYALSAVIPWTDAGTAKEKKKLERSRFHHLGQSNQLRKTFLNQLQMEDDASWLPFRQSVGLAKKLVQLFL